MTSLCTLSAASDSPKTLNLLNRITCIRDNMTVFLSISMIHLSVNFLANETECTHYSQSVWMNVVLLGITFKSLYDNSIGAWTYVFDIFGVVFGTYFQIITKPKTWWASLNIDECDIENSPIALQFFFSGEIFAFSVFIRMLLLAVICWRGWARAAVLLCMILCVFTTSLALNAVTLEISKQVAFSKN